MSSSGGSFGRVSFLDGGIVVESKGGGSVSVVSHGNGDDSFVMVNGKEIKGKSVKRIMMIVEDDDGVRTEIPIPDDMRIVVEAKKCVIKSVKTVSGPVTVNGSDGSSIDEISTVSGSITVHGDAPITSATSTSGSIKAGGRITNARTTSGSIIRSF